MSATESVQRPHWYFTTCFYCPVCAYTEEIRERQYDRKPRYWKDRNEQVLIKFCGCTG